MNTERYFTYKYEDDIQKLIDRLYDYSVFSRTNGVIALEDILIEEKNSFLKKLLMLVINGNNEEDILLIGNLLIKHYIENYEISVEFGLKNKYEVLTQLEMILLITIKIMKATHPRIIEMLSLAHYPSSDVKPRFS